LIRDSFKSIFNEYLFQAIQEKGLRDREILNDIISETLEQIRNDYPTRNDIPSSIKCSKHWWYDYLENNQRLKDLWATLPLQKSKFAMRPTYIEKPKSNETSKFCKKSPSETTYTNEETQTERLATLSHFHDSSEIISCDQTLIIQREFRLQESQRAIVKHELNSEIQTEYLQSPVHQNDFSDLN